MMMLLPPPPDTCPACATKHEPELPHNAMSLYYQYRFYGLRGRWPTHADAAAHCDPDVVAVWKIATEEVGITWTSPPEGVDLIADPPAETIHQAIGDPRTGVFDIRKGN